MGGATAIAVGHHRARARLMMAVVATHAAVALRLHLQVHQVHHRLLVMRPIARAVAISMSTMTARSSTRMVGMSRAVVESAQKLHSILLAVSWSSTWICPTRMEM